MAGYIGYSESRNSLLAKNNGSYPKSTFKSTFGIDPSKYIKRSEWHHTSCKYNCTDFYSFNSVCETIRHEHGIAVIKSKKFKEYYKEWLRNDFLNSKKSNQITAKKDTKKNWEKHLPTLLTRLGLSDSVIAEILANRSRQMFYCDKIMNPTTFNPEKIIKKFKSNENN